MILASAVLLATVAFVAWILLIVRREWLLLDGDDRIREASSKRYQTGGDGEYAAYLDALDRQERIRRAPLWRLWP